MDYLSSSDDEETSENPQPTPQPVSKASSTGKDSCARFQCPASFEEHSIADKSSLRLENIGEGKELWLIRVPNNFDIDPSVQIDVNVDAKSTFSSGGKNYQTFPTVLTQSPLKNKTRLCVPDCDGKITPAAPFHGHLTVIESPLLPKVTLPASPPSPKNIFPSGMVPRYKPFGFDGVRLPKKRRHDSENIDSPPVSKKKKKKKKHHESDKVLQNTNMDHMDAAPVDNDYLLAIHKVEDIPGPDELFSKKKKKKLKKDKR